MVMYECKCCNYITNIKTHYNRHLNTKKHKKNNNKDGNKLEKGINLPHKYHKNPQKCQKIPHKYHKIPHNSTQFLTPEKFSCKYCDKEFTRKDSLNRHINKFCKKKEKKSDILEFYKKESEANKIEKEKLYDYIEKLIEKTGDTYNIENTQNNQINLNNFGNEDISHITDKFMQKMLCIPYVGVQKLIEKIHFSNKKPENKNIALTNKKEKMIKIFANNKWKYKSKEEILDELINTNYTRMDDFYSEKGKDKLTDNKKNNFNEFQDKFEGNEEKLYQKIKNDCEMILLSDNL